MKLARASLAALFLSAIACSSVQTVRNPAEYFSSVRPALVVVVYNDNGEVPIAQPAMNGDTIVGIWHGLGEPIAVPMDQVQRVDAVQKDAKKTTLFIAALVGATAVTTYGFIRAVTDYGRVCDFTRPDDRQCYDSSPGDLIRGYR